MPHNPLVSIIIPTYNRAHLIGETLDSVLAQTYTHWECIIVDDGSSDNTDEVVGEYLKKDPRFKYYHRPDTHLPGGNGARNYGFEVSKGEYINWLDSDDLMHPEKLEKQIKDLSLPCIHASICQSQFFKASLHDSPGELWSSKELDKNKTLIESLIINDFRIPTGAVLWRKKECENVRWDESLKGAQEWLFHIMQAYPLKEKEFRFNIEIFLFIRKSNVSITTNSNTVIRFSEYLKARIILLRFLSSKGIDFNHIYFKRVYNQSLRYLKYLIINDEWTVILEFKSFFSELSVTKSLKFHFALLIFRYTQKDYFLKNLFKSNIFYYKRR